MGSWSGVAAGEGRSVPTQVNSNSENQLLTMGDDAKLEEIQKLGGTAIKPVGWDRTGWEAFQYMLYNPDTGEVLTRTPLSNSEKHTSHHGRRRKAGGDPEAGRDRHQACRMGPDWMGGVPVHALQPRHWRGSDEDPPLLAQDHRLLLHLLLLPCRVLDRLPQRLLCHPA